MGADQSKWMHYAQKDNGADVQNFVYSPISPDCDFRCLVLERGVGDEPLRCALMDRKLSDLGKYEAISYVWGKTALSDCEIICGGRRLLITPNLARALRQCRFKNRERVLWADAICIDQSDTIEKGQQVYLMGEIYANAQRTLICLGHDSDGDADAASSLVRDVNDMVERSLAEISGDWNSFPFPDVDEPLISDDRWQSFDNLRNHAWFSRVWTVQEAALAKKAHIIWGKSQLDWLEVMRTVIWANKRTSLTISIPQNHISNYYRLHEKEARTFTKEEAIPRIDGLLEILDLSRWLGVSDPRDRVYAILGIPEAKQIRGNLIVCYDEHFLEVYRDFARLYLTSEAEHPLRLLHHVHYHEHIEAASWIPMWHRTSCLYWVGSFGSTVILPPEGRALPRPKIEHYALTVRGLITDSIRTVSKAVDYSSCQLDDITVLWKQIRGHGSNLVYGSPLLAFVNAIRCGHVPSHLSTEKLARQHATWMACLEDDNKPPDVKEAARADSAQSGTFYNDSGASSRESLLLEDAPVGWQALEDSEALHARRVLHDRRVAVTQRGYLCLVPSPAKMGDLCGIIYGTETPFILREMPGGGGHYKVIGVAYIVSGQNRHMKYGRDYLKVGSGPFAYEEWLDWEVSEQDITFV